MLEAGRATLWVLIATCSAGLLNDGMDVHTLAVQMGTSILMIERHYSHLTPRLKKEMLTGKRYDTPHKDYTADLSNGFAVTDEDLQRAIDDVEIEEKLPNEPKATAVAEGGFEAQCRMRAAIQTTRARRPA